MSALPPKADIRCRDRLCFVPKGDIAGSAGRYLRNCQVLLASFECFYSKYRWQGRTISCQFSPSSKLANTEPLFVPK